MLSLISVLPYILSRVHVFWKQTALLINSFGFFLEETGLFAQQHLFSLWLKSARLSQGRIHVFHQFLESAPVPNVITLELYSTGN